ncbi:MAG: lipoprotein-releasing ABC transporter permease subunit [Alphaproteobacteria bacterium]|nr:lipoprotein-releasing ABC transporter permease subunit [Alphaproteobacteria bacterium]
MALSFETSIAFKYLRSKRKEGTISLIAVFSLLGIGLGVATLIVVMAVMNGFHTELLSRIVGISGHITVTGTHEGITEYDSLSNTIRKVPNVTKVVPFIQGQVMVTANGAATGALVRGFRLDDLKGKTVISSHIYAPDLNQFNEPDSVILGRNLAMHLGVSLGDMVTLISPQTTATPFGLVPRLKSYRVIGMFEIGMYEYDNSTILMPLEAAQLYFKLPNKVSDLEVTTKDINHTAPVVAAIQKQIGSWFFVTDWQQQNASFFDAVKVERNVMFLILTLIILVAAFNIISSLTMLVQDKSKNIAIMRTIGASRFSIMKIFFICGAFIGVTGTVFGTILGIIFSLNIENIRQFLQQITGTTLFDPVIYFLSELPAELTWGTVFSVMGMALSLSFLATIPPAWKAAKQNPAEALRYE